jgi:replicative DNA helicase
MNKYIDTLSEFGQSFQNKIIYSLIHDVKFLQDVLEILDVEYFESDSHQWIVQTTIDYFKRYKKHITMDVFSIEIKGITSDSFSEKVKDDLKQIYSSKSIDDLDFIKDEFETFCKNQKLKDAILKSTDFLKRGDYESIKRTIDEAMKAGMSKDIGHNWKEHVSLRLENLRAPTATYMEAIDNITDGGLGGGEIGVIVAPSGIGKSWALAALGFNAAMKNYNVLHITLELSADYVGRRYDTILTGKPFQVLRDNEDYLIQKLDTIPGNIDIKQFPTRGITVQGLEMYLEKVLQLKHIDVILLDYADLLGRSKHSSGNDYEDMGGIYEELRGMSMKFNVPIWTASQANRSALEKETIGADSIADSYKKVMTADFILSLIRKDIDKLNNRARVHIIKNRFGPDGMTFDCSMDTNKGLFHIHDKQVDNKAVEKENSKLEKQNLKSKFDSFKPKKDFG